MSSRLNLKSTLEFHSLFGVLPTSTLNSLSSKLTVKTFLKDQFVFMQGDPADFAYLILSGEGLLETLSAEGSTLSLGRLGTGDLFGEFSLLDDGVRSTGVITLCDMCAALIPQRDLMELVIEYPEFAMQMIKYLVRLLRQTDAQLESEHFLNLYQKLAYFLVREFSKNSSQGFRLNFTQTAIARALSASREKTNKAIRALKAKGHIESGRGYIQILDIEGLRSEYITILGPA